MPSNENSVPFPVDQLKAETLRAIAKDLGVSPGGKKDDLLKRMRTSSASGWETTTPSKRKAEEESSRRLSSAKKTKTPESGKAGASSTRSRGIQRSNALQQSSSPKNEELNPMEPNVKDVQAKYPPFDAYFISGTTSVYITVDELDNLSSVVPTDGPTVLWKPGPAFTQDEAQVEDRIHHWMIPSCDEDAVQNVAAFLEAYRKALSSPDQGSDLKTKEGDKNVDGAISAAGGDTKTAEVNGAKANGGDGEKVDKPTRAWWYELSVSRRISKGALAVKLVRGGVDDSLRGLPILPLDDIEDEAGTFWLSNPHSASKENAKLLDEVVQMIY